MYRPTVRYADVYREYVDDLFRATSLDRNQILRAALFVAGHSEEFGAIIEAHRRKDVPTPSPAWTLTNGELWREVSPQVNEGGKDVNANIRRETSVNGANGRKPEPLEQPRRQQPIPRREGAVPFKSAGGTGGITITLT